MTVDAAALRSVPLLAACTDAELQELAGACGEETFAAGAQLTWEGSAGSHLYVLLSGAAEAVADGRVVSTLGPGDVVGELALLGARDRTASVRTTADARVLVLGEREARALLGRRPELLDELLRSAVERADR